MISVEYIIMQEFPGSVSLIEKVQGPGNCGSFLLVDRRKAGVGSEFPGQF